MINGHRWPLTEAVWPWFNMSKQYVFEKAIRPVAPKTYTCRQTEEIETHFSLVHTAYIPPWKTDKQG